MDNKTILITGCSSGIGYSAAHTLKDRGYKVIASARKERDVKKLSQEGFDSVLIDLNSSESITKGFNSALDIADGGIGFLFNNAGFGQPGAVEDLSRESIREQFETNVFGTIELTNLVIPIMRNQGHGRIIFNSSILGFVAFKYRGAYIASKFAIEGFADTLRLELRDSNIFVSLIEPGPITSSFRRNSLEKFNSNIDRDNSFHREQYILTHKRLSNDDGTKTPFTLKPDAVTKKLLFALEKKHPKARYYVTFPTYLFGYLKRVLPSKALDFLLERSE